MPRVPQTIITAAVCLLLACQGNAAGTRTQAEQNLSARIIAVKLGQTSVLEEERLRIRFIEVAGDSRCPTGVTCVWEGDAEVVLQVSRLNTPMTTFRLHTNPRFEQQGHYSPYTIALRDLAPYPRSGTSLRPREYKATLSITRP
jgi:hypothetical protein